MVIYCVFSECRFSGGEGYPDPLMVDNHQADVRADIADRICSEFGSMFSKTPWPVASRTKTVYKVPPDQEVSEPTWVPGIVEEISGDTPTEKEVTYGPS